MNVLHTARNAFIKGSLTTSISAPVPWGLRNVSNQVLRVLVWGGGEKEGRGLILLEHGKRL